MKTQCGDKHWGHADWKGRERGNESDRQRGRKMEMRNSGKKDDGDQQEGWGEQEQR